MKHCFKSYTYNGQYLNNISADWIKSHIKKTVLLHLLCSFDQWKLCALTDLDNKKYKSCGRTNARKHKHRAMSVLSDKACLLSVWTCVVRASLTGQHSHWPLLWLLSSSRKWFCQCVKTGEHPLGPQHREKGCLYTVRNGGASHVLCTPAIYSCLNEPVKWVIPYSQLFSINQTDSGWCSPVDTTIVLFDF